MKILPPLNRHRFHDRSELAAHLARQVADDLRAGIEARGRASLAVSGGSTPKLFFEALSYQKLPWDHVDVTLVDERWVDEGNARSNARLVVENLIRNEARTARFIGLYAGTPAPEDSGARIEARLASLRRPFDAVVLGMGTDGHTASFFPGGDNLGPALDPDNQASAIAMRAPGAPEPRVTLTLSAVLNARALYLHIEGSEKEAVLARALEDGPAADMPIRAVLRQDRAPLNIFSCE